MNVNMTQHNDLINHNTTTGISEFNTKSYNTLDYVTAVYYILLCCFIFGGLGNIFSIIIWTRKRFRKTPRSPACLMMATANVVYVTLRFSSFAYNYLTGRPLELESMFICKMMRATLGFCQHIESWMIIILTIERLCAIVKPFTVKTIFSQVNVLICVLTVTIMFLILDGAVFENVKLDIPPWGCMVENNSLSLVRQLFISQIPLLLLIPSNIIVLISMIHQRKKIQNIVQHNEQVLIKDNYKVTGMVLCLTIVFIALTLPFQVFLICCRKIGSSKLGKVVTILTIFPSINSSINFYLYCFASKAYRKEVKKEFMRIKNTFMRFRESSVAPMASSSNSSNIAHT